MGVRGIGGRRLRLHFVSILLKIPGGKMGFWPVICLSPPNLYPLGGLLCPLAFLPLSAGLGSASLSQLWPLCFRPALPHRRPVLLEDIQGAGSPALINIWLE